MVYSDDWIKLQPDQSQAVKLNNGQRDQSPIQQQVIAFPVIASPVILQKMEEPQPSVLSSVHILKVDAWWVAPCISTLSETLVVSIEAVVG